MKDRAELDGLADNAIESAAHAATDAGLDGYLLTLALPTIQPAISSLTNRDVRRRLHEAATTPRHVRWRRGHPGARRRDHGAPRGAGRPARLPRPRRLRRRRPDRRYDEGGARDARRDDRARDAQPRGRAGPHRAAAARGRRGGTARAVGLGLLRRTRPAPRRTTSTPTRSSRTSSSTGPRARRLPRRLEALRPLLPRARRPPGLRRRRPRLRGLRRRAGRSTGQLAGPVRVRLVRPPDEAGWRLDVGVRRPVAPARHVAGRGGVPQRAQAPAGAAGPDDGRRGPHGLPRVRSRPARAVLRRRLPPAAGHRGAARLRGVPLAGQRDVGLVARGAGQLRRAPRDRASRSPRTSSTG